MLAQYLPVLMLVIFGVYAVRSMGKRRQAAANLGPAIRSFLERSGYRQAEAPSAPIEEQVRITEAQMSPLFTGSAEPFEMNLVRDFHGVAIHHHQSAVSDEKSGTRYYTCTWTLPISSRVRWQAAARSLSGAKKALKEAFSNRRMDWEPLYQTKILSGDVELDRKIDFYGEDPAAVQRVLAAPGLKQALLLLVEANLRVTAEGVTFSDPFQKNILAGVGGTVGMMAIGSDTGKFFDLTLPVHDRIAELLVMTQLASV